LYELSKQRLQRMIDAGQLASLSESRIGLEKESLRVTTSGGITQRPHPAALGSALTNPYVTTDFSEALTEMITPPCGSIGEALAYLDEIQQFVYSRLDNEILWSASMPCVVEGGGSIPIAEYGNSNVGLMKKIYRRGLGYRYGRTMQVIAGVHFNYSFSESFWSMYQQLESDTGSLRDFKSSQYMGLIRNVLRYGWMIPYLFGASPAVCKSFIKGKKTMLSEFNENTAFEPNATSLRMGDIGYTNNIEDMAGIKANYDSLDAYVQSLRCATETPYDDYEKIGTKVDGEYRQLNTNILQIENEYYSTVRPKQPPIGNEKPTFSLMQRGIEYVELRSLDVNAFHPLGVSEDQMYFLETFILFCLLQDSPTMSKSEMNEIDMNFIQTAHFGRQPGLELSRDESNITLKDWACELCQAMQGVAVALDSAHNCLCYSESIKKQMERIANPELTVSAMMLQAMRKNNEGFFHFAKRVSLQHYEHFKTRHISLDKEKLLEQAVVQSIKEQKRIEAEDKVTFDEFLQQYYAQS